LLVQKWYGDGGGNTVEENSIVHLLPKPSAVVEISKGMQAVKLWYNKISSS